MLFLIKDPGTVEDAFYTTEREISEIEGLIPEIREKIDDTNDMQIEEEKRSQEKEDQNNFSSKTEDTVTMVQNGSTKGKLIRVMCE